MNKKNLQIKKIFLQNFEFIPRILRPKRTKSLWAVRRHFRIQKIQFRIQKIDTKNEENTGENQKINNLCPLVNFQEKSSRKNFKNSNF